MNKKFFSIFFLFSFAMFSFVYASEIKWHKYEDGLKTAKDSKKKIFLHFSSKNCFYCVKMERKTFASSKVIKTLNRQFVSIKVNTDIEKNIKIAKHYKVFGLPANYFLSSNAKLIGSLPGYIDSNKMIKVLKVIRKVE